VYPAPTMQISQSTSPAARRAAETVSVSCQYTVDLIMKIQPPRQHNLILAIDDGCPKKSGQPHRD
jgi:hypothetical protein